MDFISQKLFTEIRSCYSKCVKVFFGYKKYDSVTVALFETRVPSFDTVLHNARYTFHYKWNSCHNSLVFSLHSIKSD